MRRATLLAAMFLPGAAAMAQEATGTGPQWEGARAVGMAIAAALTIGLAVIGAAYAVAKVGSAAMGAAAEKPEVLTRSLLFVALAEGLAVLGFVIAVMILQKI